MKWEVILFGTGGNEVVSKFIDSLPKTARGKVVNQLLLLEEYGIRLTMPHARPMGGGLYELRVRGKVEVRTFYIFARGKRIYVLHGFIKKTQQTPPKELSIARERQKLIEND